VARARCSPETWWKKSPGSSSGRTATSSSTPATGWEARSSKNGLAHEVRIVVFPVGVGTGARPLAGVGTSKAMRLVRTERIGGGLMISAYEFM
jgi:hypothetical protein